MKDTEICSEATMVNLPTHQEGFAFSGTKPHMYGALKEEAARAKRIE